MRKRSLGLLLSAAALVLSGCSAPGPPQVSFYTDGDTARASPMVYCDVMVRDCDQASGPVSLPARAGMPVQISVPDAVAETPWTVTVQYRDANGAVRYMREVFTDREQYAYTADPPGEDSRIIVVEIQQLGAAYAANQEGKPMLDASGSPQLVARGVWSLQIERA